MVFKPKCLIFGHSFIKRLERKQRTEPWTVKADFGLYQCRITLRGFSGLNFGLEDGETEKRFYAIVGSVFRRNAYDSDLPVRRHNQQFVSWVYLYLITAAAEHTLISMGNTFWTCVFFESKTNRTAVQTDCTMLMLSKWAPSSEFVSSSIPSWQTSTAHAQPFRGARDLAFCLKVPLDSLLV